MDTAIVVAIDRAAGELLVRMPDGSSARGAYVGKYPPPPTSRVAIIEDEPLLLGRVVGDRRLVFHDDFLFVDAIGLVPRYGDTPWTFPLLGDQGTAISIGTATDAAGAMRLETNDGNTTIGITKTDQAPVDGLAYWLSGRIRSAAYNNNEVIFGFRSADGLAQALIYMSEPLNSDIRWAIAIRSGGAGIAQRFEGTTPLSDTWQTFDLLLVPNQYLAAWVDGNGPGVIASEDTTIPNASADVLAPSFLVVARNVPAARQADIDWMRLEAFTPAMRPQDLVGAVS